jgi:hypothetical protein
MAADDLHGFILALLLPLKHLSEVRHCDISRTLIPALLGGLLSDNEASQLALNPIVRTLSKIVKELQDHLYVRFTHSFFISLSLRLGHHLANFLESFRSL